MPQNKKTLTDDWKASFLWYVRLLRLLVSFEDAALGGTNEGYDFVAQFAFRNCLLHAGYRAGGVEVSREDDAVNFLKQSNLFGGESAATQTDDVNAGIGARVTTTHYISRNILIDE